MDSERLIGNHTRVVEMLAERALVSVHHELFGEAQGTEFRHTIYLYRHVHMPFHIDYIFMPREGYFA
jgi:hypothetical protein